MLHSLSSPERALSVLPGVPLVCIFFLVLHYCTFFFLLEVAFSGVFLGRDIRDTTPSRATHVLTRRAARPNLHPGAARVV